MTVADGSRVRLADVAEVAIGTTPATPAFLTRRYVSSDLKISKQVDSPNEVRADRNVGDIVDVGRSVKGTINTLLSYGSYDEWFECLLCGAWTDDVLKNGVIQKARTFEQLYPQGASNTFIRYQGCQFDTLAMQLTPRQSIAANWGVIGLRSPDPTAVIITGATYAAPSTTPVMNAGLNVADLTFTGIENAPVLKSLTLNIANNTYQDDAVGSYDTYAQGLGRFEVTGSFEAYFENQDTYKAILDHSDVGLAFTLGSTTLEKYQIEIPMIKLTDGGPAAPGNGQSVTITVPFSAKYDPTSAAAITITRAVA